MPDIVADAAETLRKHLDDRKPEIFVTLGSGLSGMADRIEDAVDIDVASLPGTVASKVPGHTARLRCGRLGGRTVLAQMGRIHLYEGHDAAAVTRLVQVAATIGCRTYIVTNAAGGLEPRWSPGDLMVISDHLNLTGTSPLTGIIRDGGPVFLDMSEAYDTHLQQLAHRVAADAGFALRSGVYAGLVGPVYETPAEVAMLRTLGAQAVGMSTVNEVIAARAHDMAVLGVSSITNIHGEGVETSHEEVLEVGAAAAERLGVVVLGVLQEL